jgi:hypothetical protein
VRSNEQFHLKLKSQETLMKLSKLPAACVAAALLPMAAIAADQTSTNQDATSTASAKKFDKLDNDRDGRLSKLEAASDSKLMFSSIDTNGDGYIDRMEYNRRDASSGSTRDAVPSSQSPESASPNSPGTSSKTDPNQQQGTQPATSRPEEEKPQR